MTEDLTDKYAKYMGVAKAIAALSKDASTKVGAVLVDADGAGGPWGYNGACRGSAADEIENLSRARKLRVFEHAERNAIYSAARQGFPTKDCVLVCTHFPCCDCARAIVQSGISHVICEKPTPEFENRWHLQIKESKALFEECGVSLTVL